MKLREWKSSYEIICPACDGAGLPANCDMITVSLCDNCNGHGVVVVERRRKLPEMMSHKYASVFPHENDNEPDAA